MSTIEVSNYSDGTDTVGSEYLVHGSAKAWVNFNGTGTVAVRDSFNVSSLTDVGTGDYNVNHSNNMSSANFSTSLSSNSWNRYSDSGTVGDHRVHSASSSHTLADTSVMFTAIYGDLA